MYAPRRAEYHWYFFASPSLLRFVGPFLGFRQSLSEVAYGYGYSSLVEHAARRMHQRRRGRGVHGHFGVC